MFRIFTLLFLVSIFFSCGNDKKTVAAKPTTQVAKPAAPALNPPLPSISLETAQHLFANCDYIDYIFYNTNFSVSQAEKASIQSALTHIAQQSPPGLNPNCKAIGRVYYQIQGDNYLEADIYFQDGCKYFVFYENKKPAYCNLMTDNGMAYYTNIFKQVQGTGPQ